jgi:hypothetical protein
MLKLTNGAEIDFDWSAISQKEWRALLANETDDELTDLIVGKLVGMTAEELGELSPVDFVLIKNGVVPSFREAIDTSTSKNSAGASTSD